MPSRFTAVRHSAALTVDDAGHAEVAYNTRLLLSTNVRARIEYWPAVGAVNEYTLSTPLAAVVELSDVKHAGALSVYLFVAPAMVVNIDDAVVNS